MDQTICHLDSSNLNLLEHLSRPHDGSLNWLNIFLGGCEEFIQETLTRNISRLLEELHSVKTRIINTVVTEHDFMINSNHPCSLP